MYIVQHTDPRAGYMAPEWRVVRTSDGYTVSYHRSYTDAQGAADFWNVWDGN